MQVLFVILTSLHSSFYLLPTQIAIVCAMLQSYLSLSGILLLPVWILNFTGESRWEEFLTHTGQELYWRGDILMASLPLYSDVVWTSGLHTFWDPVFLQIVWTIHLGRVKLHDSP